MTFVDEVESAGWFEADSSTVEVTCADGDVLVASAVCGNQLRTLTIDDTAGGGGLTWELHGSVVATARCSIAQWTAVVGPGQGGTFDVTVTYPSAGAGGVNVSRWSDVEVGADAVADATDPAAPSLNITTTVDDAAVVVVVGDHETVDGSGRTWRTGAGALTELTYFRSNSENAAYVGYHADADAAGVKTVGLTLPNDMRPSIAAVELVPAAGEDIEQPIDPAGETDAAQPLGAGKTMAAGAAGETDTAQPLGAAKARALGTAAATEEARPLGRHKQLALGIAVDTSTAQPLGSGKALALGTATESATAVAFGAAKARALGTATERDTAVAIQVDEPSTPTVGGNGLQVEEITARGESFIRELGVVETVNGGDIRHMAGRGLHAAWFFTALDPVPAASGLASVTVRLAYTIRLYGNVQTEPSDALDPAMLKAVDTICNAFVRQFTLGGLVRNVDVKGAHGEPMRARSGYVPLQGEQECRVVDIVMPLICNDVWIEEA
jgi:hypothetical protein